MRQPARRLSPAQCQPGRRGCPEGQSRRNRSIVDADVDCTRSLPRFALRVRQAIVIRCEGIGNGRRPPVRRARGAARQGTSAPRSRRWTMQRRSPTRSTRRIARASSTEISNPATRTGGAGMRAPSAPRTQSRSEADTNRDAAVPVEVVTLLPGALVFDNSDLLVALRRWRGRDGCRRIDHHLVERRLEQGR